MMSETGQEPESTASADASRPRRRWRRRLLRGALAFGLGVYAIGWILDRTKATMQGRDLYSQAVPVEPEQIELLIDLTGQDSGGNPRVEQEIFASWAELIEMADSAIVLDMFLINQFRGVDADSEPYRDSSGDLVDLLVRKLAEKPDMLVLFITDPVNGLYDDRSVPEVLAPVVEAGGHVVLTDLRQLRTDNPLYSCPWRVFGPLVRSVNLSRKPVLPNPFEAEGEAFGLAQWGELLNFKANHRKVLAVCDAQGRWHAVVGGANPHTASSAHSNAAIRLDAGPLREIVCSEIDVAVASVTARPELLKSKVSREVFEARLQTLREDWAPRPEPSDAPDLPRVRYCSEGMVGRTVDRILEQAGPGDRLELLMFYLADHRVLKGLREAAERGAAVRMVLDPNKDSFGRKRGGTPNRPLATNLHDWCRVRELDLEIRWFHTHGEQAHFKALRYHHGVADTDTFLIGSANFTRRNLRGSNLESAILVENGAAMRESWETLFARVWGNPGDVRYTGEFRDYEMRGWEGAWKSALSRFQSATGLSTF